MDPTAVALAKVNAFARAMKPDLQPRLLEMRRDALEERRWRDRDR